MQRGAAEVDERRPPSRRDNPLVRAVGRLPASVSTKLLIAFVGTAILRRRGRRPRAARARAVERPDGNPRSTPGTSIRYGKLQSDTSTSAFSSRRTSGRSSTRSTPAGYPIGRGARQSRSDRAVQNLLARIGAETPRRHPRLRASRRGRSASFARSADEGAALDGGSEARRVREQGGRRRESGAASAQGRAALDRPEPACRGARQSPRRRRRTP